MATIFKRRDLTHMRFIRDIGWQFQFKLQDCWLGAFWQVTPKVYGHRSRVNLWVCVVPMIPLHVTWVI